MTLAIYSLSLWRIVVGTEAGCQKMAALERMRSAKAAWSLVARLKQVTSPDEPAAEGLCIERENGDKAEPGQSKGQACKYDADQTSVPAALYP